MNFAQRMLLRMIIAMLQTFIKNPQSLQKEKGIIQEVKANTDALLEAMDQ